MSERRDGYGRCFYCGLGKTYEDHVESCPQRREWRPLRNSEYPPPGPTRTTVPIERDGRMVAPIEVFAMVGRGGGSHS